MVNDEAKFHHGIYVLRKEALKFWECRCMANAHQMHMPPGPFAAVCFWSSWSACPFWCILLSKGSSSSRWMVMVTGSVVVVVIRWVTCWVVDLVVSHSLWCGHQHSAFAFFFFSLAAFRFSRLCFTPFFILAIFRRVRWCSYIEVLKSAKREVMMLIRATHPPSSINSPPRATDSRHSPRALSDCSEACLTGDARFATKKITKIFKKSRKNRWEMQISRMST